jgi:ABC-type uncharacterized transport system substrate-binding protein
MTRRRSLRPALSGAGAALAALLPAAAGAHPHAWIDLKTSAVFDDAGAFVGVHVDWLFDDFYSLFILEEIGSADGTIPPEALMDLAQRNLRNLAEYSYFTFIEVDGAKGEYAAPQNVHSELRDGRLAMQFTVPLLQPVDVRTSAVSYGVYDPTYYIEVLHMEEGDAVTLSGAAPNGCAAELQKPAPSMADVALAASLDQTETAGEGLGELFAEIIVIRCTK